LGTLSSLLKSGRRARLGSIAAGSMGAGRDDEAVVGQRSCGRKVAAEAGDAGEGALAAGVGIEAE
jgi:hypothetical protein